MKMMQRPNRLLVLLLACVVGTAPVLAAPPSWAGGGGKHAADDDRGPQGGKAEHGPKERKAEHGPKKAKRADEHGDRHVQAHGGDAAKGTQSGRRQPVTGAYFDDRNRDAVRQYYAAHPQKACPPGLAKKHNGCLPPGQAKKWQVGHPLPADVVYAPVPQPVLVLLPRQPTGYRYVQVASDILLIAVGTKMVVDGFNGLAGR